MLSITGLVDLQAGENILETSYLLYTSPEQRLFNGKLYVTNQRLIYRAVSDISGSLNSYSLPVGKHDKDAIHIINKAAIARIEVKKSFMAKRVILTLTDGTTHTFNHGMMCVDKLVSAINQK